MAMIKSQDDAYDDGGDERRAGGFTGVPNPTPDPTYTPQQPSTQPVGTPEVYNPGPPAGTTIPDNSWWDNNVAGFVPNGVAPSPTGYVMQNGSLVGNTGQSQQQAADPYGWIDETLRSVNSTDDPSYWRRVIAADPNGSGSARAYWIDRIRRGDGSALVANGTLSKFQDGGASRAPATGSYGAYPYAPYPYPQQSGGQQYQGSGSVFDDPATKAWLDLLNKRIDALNTPQQNPQLDQLNGYLQKYFESLQGPTYTPQQLDLMQTQSLDPLTRERDAALQRATEQASARGFANTGGVADARARDIERQFEELRTKTQAGFAAKAVDLDRINQQQAAGVAQLLANIENTQFNQNESRANQAVAYAQQVPELADRRFAQAAGLVGQNSLNPTSLLQLESQNQLQNSAQTQQMWLSLASLIPGLLNLFK